ncbi:MULTISPECIES: glutathione transferase GstA [Pseudomonas]|uniref:Glutathione transferase GstA n=2 Tax=Pseudomonas TaxID=286 RepID=A0A4Y9TF34_PSEFL|nr:MULTISPECIES: glutathione transferase GstA [Pseudomonas]CRM95832.1 Glutathione S-transferase GST-6.0 [Pseudomonas sp. 22 E 5]MCX9152827.1 glutathione transferase GstA [Pseudomonas sp. TB1-B1]QXH66323.1 glutathione transferase GstA [Pseudomonas asgharzadehiana]TFW43025.1 glutathione transferase GstA [Pseudomonas fluorescens]CRM04392.1 Glutathione S-transferase GST-6.0 [Pseudomonas sp. 31 E 5]
MKLYFSPNACSLAPHIVLRELALPFDLVRVDNQAKTTADGEDFLQINPKGYVAALQLDNGQVLTEASAILQYLADLKPDAELAPANGSWERVRLQEWLNFIASEVHGGLAVFFNSAIQGDIKAMFMATLFKRFAILVQTLERQDYLMGSQFSVADVYLFVVLRWADIHAINLREWPALAAFQQRVSARPTVIAALAAENR